MKKICKKNNAIKYVYQFMTESEEKKYSAHLKECKKCRMLLDKITRLRKIIDYRQKIKDRLPSVNRLQYPEQKNDSILWRNILLQIRNKKSLKYAMSIPLIIILILSTFLFLMKKDVSKETSLITKEEEQKEIIKIKPKKILIAKKVLIKKKEQKWCFNTGGPLRSQPVLQNGILYFGSDDKAAYSINSKTGKLIWEYQTGGRISSAPIINNNFVYVASTDGFLYKLNSQTGKMTWNRKIGTLVESQIFINHSEIYIANNDGEITSLNLDGKELWKKRLNIHIYSDINGDKDFIYFGTGKGIIYSLSKRKGKINWSYNTGSSFISSKPLVLSNQLILGDTRGILYSFDKSKGVINWKFKTKNQIVVDPICFKDRIYLASDKLYCLNLNGKEIWKYTTLSSIDIDFAICNNLITLIDNSNNIYSIHSESGYGIKEYTSDDSILSFICAYNKIYAGNEEGEICVLK